ncbi:MAG: DUF515 domain-containing protein, partial [Methanobrevibacter sp.]|nr:DUF515 domain-containing protein [Candidatus Methanoflexus mossambicus]
YERASNLAEIDIEYLVLIEVPQEDVTFVINNMEDLIITIPTQHAPDWMNTELQSTYKQEK